MSVRHSSHLLPTPVPGTPAAVEKYTQDQVKSRHYPFNASVSKGAASTIFNAFGMAWPGFEPTTYYSRNRRSTKSYRSRLSYS